MGALPLQAVLPEPDEFAQAHSKRVVTAVRADIAANGGWISVARYMELALYAPGLGYYVAGTRKFGVEGDFITAPEMTSLFAQALARPVEEVLARSEPRDLLELGAGSGVLAADLLNALAAVDALPTRYRILDLGPELRERQRNTIRERARPHLSRVEWITTLPATIGGAVVLNEVLDAVPAHIVVRRSGRWFERGVTWREGLSFEDRPLGDVPLRAMAIQRFPKDVDYASELNPAAEALVADIGSRMTAGALLIIDYGFAQHEYYHAQRSDGTLMGHYRHRAHADPFLWPGLSDLTTHVDFSAIALAGERSGLAVSGYASMSAFLVGAGILDCLAAIGEPTSLAYLREASAVQTLLSPAEMGELFKALALAKSPDIEWNAFAMGDRSHRL